MKKKEGKLSRAKVVNSKSHEITGGNLLVSRLEQI
jgi:hypothetical protein